MNKLTAEKCREMINDMAIKREVNGLSIRENRYFEALEIALPVLEQREKGDDGWIEWGGGLPPVEANKRVEVKFRNGVISEDAACWLDWSFDFEEYDAHIIAYRVVQDRERGEEK